MAEPEQHSPSLLQVIGITLPIILVMVFLVISLNTGDFLWFYPVFDEIPIGMLVHCYGNDVEINPGDPAFAPVSTAVNQVISGAKRWDELTLSDETYQEYQTNSQMVILELFYDPSVRIHSSYKFMKSIDAIVIPLVGRHAQYNTLFGRMREYTAAGSFHFKSMTPIEEAVQAQGICPLP